MSFEEVMHIHANSFEQVIPFDPSSDSLLQLDFTDANKDLTAEILADTPVFSNYISHKLDAAGARYGIGGYNEHRTVYSRSKVFDAAIPSEEPRRLHLGTDIWGKPHTAVMAPIDGVVHSFAFNDQFGDYGATIILSHQLNGFVFYSLYGHLNLASLRGLQEGQLIKAGEVFAAFGIPHENGQWPPHLHFQLILDMGDWKGDYPGVCKFSEREKWLKNSPDPEWILGMNKFLG
ncbi:peptidoglycan DD-metalloendopeptidase family protein [Terrimonas sp. NA20]|uniref:Peptidoglycan DD-metalloendopeptidase family protein n=1 Tax=Terrimonas ginsenosidimutans TaxID=2908004 RepID=A0ABS9KQH2_9BACT|nr:peptidoglycan DD-metalloendopeptidase family protein [Terrimonas ginsenosidimutans]MCG2614551.1 peptidoglycan DD-metalloendopeptidase family protein [Terrimonas ginsenosidimutans]